jgi:hypothetical protein
MSDTIENFDAPATFTCRSCGKDRPYDRSLMLDGTLKPTICSSCIIKACDADKREREAARHAAFLTLCPDIYQRTDPDRPGFPKAKLARIMAWQYGPRGIAAHGETRRCKSRCLWLLIQRLIMEGRSVAAMTGGQLGRSCAEALSEGGAAPRDWFDHLATIDVLFIDDLDKAKFTDRVLAELFDIIETRVAHELPILITTNATGDTLTDKMKTEGAGFAAEPLIARIREFCDPISF